MKNKEIFDVIEIDNGKGKRKELLSILKWRKGDKKIKDLTNIFYTIITEVAKFSNDTVEMEYISDGLICKNTGNNSNHLYLPLETKNSRFNQELIKEEKFDKVSYFSGYPSTNKDIIGSNHLEVIASMAWIFNNNVDKNKTVEERNKEDEDFEQFLNNIENDE